MIRKVLSIRMAMIILVFFLSVFTVSGCASSGQTTDNAGGGTAQNPGAEQTKSNGPKEIKTSITVWTWEPQSRQQSLIDEFNKDFPGIEVTFTTVDGPGMVTKIQTALAAGSDLPDVAWLEISQRGKLISLDAWEDLTKPPYNVDTDTILDFELPLSMNEKGELVGIEVSPPVAGLAYKRDLAREYFGTDDPEQLEKMFPNWDEFIKKGLEVKQKSNGEVFMFASLNDVVNIFKNQNPEPYVKDNQLNLDQSVKVFLTKALEMKNVGIVDKLEQGPAHNASYAGKKHIFYPAATWAPTWVIKANDKNGSGNWGIMQAPGGGYLNGGTIVAIPKKAKNKEAAFEYIRWMYLSEKGAQLNRDLLEYFSPYKPVYDDPEFYSKPDEFFGGQDVLKKFSQDIAKNMNPSRPVSKYDLEINEAIGLAVKTINSADNNRISIDELIEKMEEDLLSKIPELSR